jgi:hypothetical protein
MVLNQQDNSDFSAEGNPDEELDQEKRDNISE